MKQRDRTLDIAKGISMVLVVSYHIILCSPETEATFQTWPRGWFHIPKDPDFPVPS